MNADLVARFDLTGRSAVVTGAGSGIGQATAITLAAAGAVVVVADIDDDGGRDTVSAITRAGGRAEQRHVDVSRRGEVDALVEHAVTTFGRLDVMANVAGIISQAPVTDIDEAELDRILAVNLKGTFFGCQAALRAMARQGSGSIVNMSSGGIDAPSAGLACYAMTKAAIAQLTKTVAAEGGPSGVRANAIAPGFVITNMTSRHFRNDDGTVDEARKEATLKPMRAMSPLGVVGDADDIALCVLYLASDASRFMTGQILRPNGGVAMPW